MKTIYFKEETLAIGPTRVLANSYYMFFMKKHIDKEKEEPCSDKFLGRDILSFLPIRMKKKQIFLLYQINMIGEKIILLP